MNIPPPTTQKTYLEIQNNVVPVCVKAAEVNILVQKDGSGDEHE
jgi:hypothetical protein